MLYAILFHDTKEMVSPESIRKHWPNYGHGYYKTGRKAYSKLGTAKGAMHHLPKQILPMVGVYEMEPGKLVHTMSIVNVKPPKELVEELKKQARAAQDNWHDLEDAARRARAEHFEVIEKASCRHEKVEESSPGNFRCKQCKLGWQGA